jgi:PAS domain S-box-containing protein
VKAELNRTGIDVLGDVPWGAHFSLFYQSNADLIATLVPYFAAGLEANELCVWAPSEPSLEEASLEALRELVPDFDRHLEAKSLEFFRYQDFFGTNGDLDIARMMAQWRKWDRRAHDEGYAGLRGSGNLCWVQRANWKTCTDYEHALHTFIVGRRMMVLCSYPLESTEATDVLDSARDHHLVFALRDGTWDMLEVPALARSKDELQRLNTELEQRVEERNRQLSSANEELYREIDERRRVEVDLRRSETYLQHAQRLSHTGSFAGHAADQKLTFLSAEAFRIFGLDPRPDPPDREEIFSLIHPADRARVSEVTERMGREQCGDEYEFRIVRPDGSVRHVHAICSPVVDGAGRLEEFVGSIIDVTDQKRAAARLARVRRAARERTLRARFAATLEERTRLARDIHDTLLQGVTGIGLQLRATLPNLGAAPEGTVHAIRHIVELADATVRDARRAVWDMRAPALAQNGLASVLEEEVRRRANGVRIDFSLRGTPRRIPAAAEDAIYRIGQEAVINAARHSGARAIWVALVYRQRSVRLTVEDDGRGFHVQPVGRSHGGHWGLIGMRERAERIDAPLDIRSGAGEGTTVELVVPLARTDGRSTETAPRLAQRRRPPASLPAGKVLVDADSRVDG